MFGKMWLIFCDFSKYKTTFEKIFCNGYRQTQRKTNISTPSYVRSGRTTGSLWTKKGRKDLFDTGVLQRKHGL
jgi:hypothetical protein